MGGTLLSNLHLLDLIGEDERILGHVALDLCNQLAFPLEPLQLPHSEVTTKQWQAAHEDGADGEPVLGGWRRSI